MTGRKDPDRIGTPARRALTRLRGFHVRQSPPHLPVPGMRGPGGGDDYPRRIKWTDVALKEAVTVIPVRKPSSSRDWTVI